MDQRIRGPSMLFPWGSRQNPKCLSSFLGCPTPHARYGGFCSGLAYVIILKWLVLRPSNLQFFELITLLGTITHISTVWVDDVPHLHIMVGPMWCDGFLATSHPIISPGGPTLLATSTAAKKAGGKQSWGDDNGTVATGHHHVLVAKSIGKMLLTPYIYIYGSFQKWVEKYHRYIVFGCIFVGKFSPPNCLVHGPMVATKGSPPKNDPTIHL